MGSSSIMKIVIIGAFRFPFGSPSAARVRTLAKGLTENGAEVRIVTVASVLRKGDPEKSGKSVLNWNDITYECTNCFDPGEKPTFRAWLSNYFSKNVRAWLKLKKYIKKDCCDVVIVYGRNFLTNFVSLMITKCYCKPVFLDLCEWLTIDHFKGGWRSPFYWSGWANRVIVATFCRGLICISTYIARKFSFSKIPCFVLPSIYDFSTQPTEPSDLDKQRNSEDVFTVIYAGQLKKVDGFEQLREAIKNVYREGCPVVLKMLGVDELSAMGAMEKEICQKDEILRYRVKFLGWVSEETYPHELASADCLVLPRLNCRMTQASFPNRLPEYLATGVPVLTSCTGDLPMYLDDGVHAELVYPFAAKFLADRMLCLWKNPERARQIGLAGRERGAKVFDYKANTRNLMQFIREHRS